MITAQICVDAGGTKTAFRLYIKKEYKWQKKEEFLLGPASLTQQGAVAFQTINQGIEKLIKTYQLNNQYLMVVVGAAGAGNTVLKEQLISKLCTYPYLVVTTDAHTSCLGANLGESVNAIAIGTGTVAITLDQSQQLTMFGGWGFPIGDMGGGAWLGQQAVRCLIDSLETNSSSLLSQYMESQIGYQRSDILDWISKASAFNFAQFTPKLIELAEKNCDKSQLILFNGFKHILDLMKKCSHSNNFNFVFLGSLGSYYQRILEKSSSEFCSKIIEKKGDALDGAHLLGLQNMEEYS